VLQFKQEIIMPPIKNYIYNWVKNALQHIVNLEYPPQTVSSTQSQSNKCYEGPYTTTKDKLD